MDARIFLKQLRMGLILYMRVPAAIFWIIAFPLLMLLVLGTVFGSGGDLGVRLVWEHPGPQSEVDTMLLAALKERGALVELESPDAAEARWTGGKLPVMLLTQDGHYTLRVNSYLAGQAQPIEAMVQEGFLIAQAHERGLTGLARIPVVMSSPGGHHEAPYAAFLLPGLLGLNVLMMGVFSTGIVDVTLRAKGGYKRLATTPLPRYVYLGAQLTVRLIVLLFSAALLMLVGAVVFGSHNQGSYASLLFVEMLGAACFISLGYLLASFAQTPEVYSGIANLTFLPLMLLSGVYFSLEGAPAWLQRAADLLPLSPLLRVMRAIFNDGAALASQWTGVVLIAAWTLVLFVLATRRFKWV
jgi:ABC-type multidrug transport system permease subunit